MTEQVKRGRPAKDQEEAAVEVVSTDPIDIVVQRLNAVPGGANIAIHVIALLRDPPK